MSRYSLSFSPPNTDGTLKMLWAAGRKDLVDIHQLMFFFVLLKVIFYFHPFLGGFLGLCFIFSRLLKQILVCFFGVGCACQSVD